MVLFRIHGTTISPDASWYLNNGFKLYTDFSFENLMIRRPLLPFLISLSFHLFGRSIESALWVVRFFFVLNILLSYFVGLKLFSRSVGIIFSLLVLTSFVINQWSSVLLVDAILPFFILLYLLALYLAFERQSLILFGLSGLVMGTTFLVKEVFGLIYMVLPLCLLVLKPYRNRLRILGILLSYAAVLLVLLPWVWTGILQHDFSVLLGPLADASKVKASGVLPLPDNGQGFWAAVPALLRELSQFFTIYIAQVFVLSSLLAAGSVYCLVRVFTKEKRPAHVVLLFSVILFSPIIYIGMKSGGINFRNGQFLLLYFFLYLMSAVLISDFSNGCGYIFSRFFLNGRTAGKINIFLVCSLAALCIVFQTFVGREKDKTFYALLKKTKVHTVYGFSLGQEGFDDRSGWANQTTRDASHWIQQNIPAHEPILCQWEYLRMLDYLTDNQYKFHKVQYGFSHTQSQKKALFVWPRYDAGVMAGNSLVALYEEDFLSQINTHQIQYVVVTSRRNFLTLYLQEHPGFELVYSITRASKNIKIFKVLRFPVDPIGQFTVKLQEDVVSFFKLSDRENSRVFEGRINEMKRILHWDDSQVSAFVTLVTHPDSTLFWREYERVNSKTVY